MSNNLALYFNAQLLSKRFNKPATQSLNPEVKFALSVLHSSLSIVHWVKVRMSPCSRVQRKQKLANQTAWKEIDAATLQMRPRRSILSGHVAFLIWEPNLGTLCVTVNINFVVGLCEQLV